jgi:23S rRNA (adenine2503-C2)-methyltransferase
VSPRPHIYGMLPADLDRLLATHGIEGESGDVRRLLAYLIFHDGQDLRPSSPVSRRVRQAVAELTERRPLEVVERVADPVDGFVKYLFRSFDGAHFEGVRIPLHRPGRFTVCLSSQVGCAMACRFCATGQQGLTRNLEAWEMVGAWLAVRREAPGQVTGAVFMGQGEPLQNYDPVIQAAHVLSEPCGGRIGGRGIGISTVGFPETIRRYTREGHRFRLILSLNSAIEERRQQLMPVAGRVSLVDLAQAVREHDAVSPGRQTIGWVLLSGINTGADEVEALRELLVGVRLRINLIDYNEVDDIGFTNASDKERNQFFDRLQVLRVPVVRRYSGGASCHAACGMMRGRCGIAPTLNADTRG